MDHISVQELDQRIQDLRRIRDMLGQLIAELEQLSGQTGNAELPFLQVLALFSKQKMGMYQDHLREVEKLIDGLEQLKEHMEEMIRSHEDAVCGVMEHPERPQEPASPAEDSADPPEPADSDDPPEPADSGEPSGPTVDWGPYMFQMGLVANVVPPLAALNPVGSAIRRVKDLFGARSKKEAVRPADAAPPDLSRVQFSAVAPKRLVPGEYGIVDVVMYEQQFRHVVDELLRQAEQPMRETRSGVLKVAVGSRITVRLTSPDAAVDEAEQTMTWQGDYLDFSFAVTLPEGFAKRQALFTADVYFDGVPAVKLRFVMECGLPRPQTAEVIRRNIMSAFVSYASEDRSRVASVIQGMKKIRPELDVFFDVNSLRSGENWARSILEQIEQRDVLFLCWSHFASASPWVEKEWRYALERKGIEGIEPIPFESPSVCPPPAELSAKHFNDQLLYIVNAK